MLAQITNARQQERCYKNMEYVRTRYEEKSHHFYLDLTRNAVECMIIDFSEPLHPPEPRRFRLGNQGQREVNPRFLGFVQLLPRIV